MKFHTPNEVVNYLHSVGCSNDLVIFQDIMLSREGVHCTVCGHSLDYDSETEEWIIS